MRIRISIVGNFICSFIFSSIIYAAPAVTNDSAISEADIIAANASQELAPVMELPADTSQIMLPNQPPSSGNVMPTPRGMSQQELAKTLPKGAVNQPVSAADTTSIGMPQQESARTVPVMPANQLTSSRDAPTIGMPQQQESVQDLSRTQSPTISQENSNSVGLAGEPVGPEAKSLSDRLTVLETQNGALKAQIAQMNERVNLVEEKLIGNVSVPKTSEYSTSFKTPQLIDNLRNYLGPKLFTIVVSTVIGLFCLLLIYIIFPRRRNHTSASHTPDFNPMEGQEGIVAKLNLARAYIEMGKESEAQNMLQYVLAHGSDAEQKEARELLEKIK